MLKDSLTEKSGDIKFSPAVREVATWLEQQLHATKFGEVGVQLTVHDGKVTKVARTVTEKLSTNGASR